MLAAEVQNRIKAEMNLNPKDHKINLRSHKTPAVGSTDSETDANEAEHISPQEKLVNGQQTNR
jgi:hypothetical protein